MLRTTYSSKDRKVFLVFLSFLVIFFLGIRTAYSDSVIEGGTTVIEMGDLKVSDGGVLTNNGTLILKGNFNNENNTPTTIGGMVEFSGSSAQVISGENTFNNLTLNNTNGLTITGNTGLSGTLTWTNGLINIGSNNFSFIGSATYTGTPGTGRMFVADGSGKVRKQWTSTGAFTFPVGDNTGTVEYSPVVLDFTDGNNWSDFFVWVNLVDSKYPDDSISGSYLTRYWNLEATGTADDTLCDARFDYPVADVEGDEGEIFTIRINPLTTYDLADPTHFLVASDLTKLGTFTGGKGALQVDFKVLFEGPYAGGGTMNTTLKGLDLIPLSQPFGSTAWAYDGPESVLSIPDDVVDWVLVELRQADIVENATNRLAWRAGFLLSDGTITDLDGINPLKFYNKAITNNLYPVIIHRNHLDVIAGNPVLMNSESVYSYDFTINGHIYGAGKKNLGSGIWGLVAGDADQDETIQSSDYVLWRANSGIDAYNLADFDMDGTVQSSDYVKWKANSGIDSSVPQYSK